MPVTAQLQHQLLHESKPLYFRSAGRKAKFTADPGQYLPAGAVAPEVPAAAPEPQAEPAPAGAIYTCLMRPEVRQDHPGVCPKCGMAPEPRAGQSGGEPIP